MADHSLFEIEVLGWVAEDYEAPHTIGDDIGRELKRPTSEAEVRAALVALAQSGMVQAYVYEPQSHRYEPVAASQAAQTDTCWFMATAQGIAERERYAS